jgi:hypothetical protein
MAGVAATLRYAAGPPIPAHTVPPTPFRQRRSANAVPLTPFRRRRNSATFSRSDVML